MPKFYSEDLRQKAMNTYKKTGHKSNTCSTYNIARTTLDDWIQLEQQTGQLAQPKLINVGRPSVIHDFAEFKIFIENTKFSQVKDLVPLFKNHFGYEVSYSVLLSAVHKLGWSRKKRAFFTNKLVQ